MEKERIKSTYTNGITFKTTKSITKKDMITLCDLLKVKFPNDSFEPEAIIEGGIKYKYEDNRYKSVRLCAHYNSSRGEWPRINDNVMSEWKNNDDIIFPEENTFSTYLKSFHGAPVFTLDELKIWEKCFNEIGIVRVGRYPGQKRLTCLM